MKDKAPLLIRCPFGIGYENDCKFEGDQKQLLHHLLEKEDKHRLAMKLTELTLAEQSRTKAIPKMLKCPECDGFIGVNDEVGIAGLAFHIDEFHYKDKERLCYGYAEAVSKAIPIQPMIPISAVDALIAELEQSAFLRANSDAIGILKTIKKEAIVPEGNKTLEQRIHDRIAFLQQEKEAWLNCKHDNEMEWDDRIDELRKLVS